MVSARNTATAPRSDIESLVRYSLLCVRGLLCSFAPLSTLSYPLSTLLILNVMTLVLDAFPSNVVGESGTLFIFITDR